MEPLHINAKIGDIANIVIMPGDPLRAKFIAEKYLDNSREVTNARNMLGFTGEYKGKRVTIMGSGMGMPSMSIYSFELFEFYNVDIIIRIGTCGTNNKDINLGDIVLAKSSYNEGNFSNMLLNEKVHISFPSKELNDIIKRVHNKKFDERFKLREENIVTAECFDAYTNAKDFYSRFDESLKIAACEMEAYALFEVARYKNKKSACILTVVDSVNTKEKYSIEDREKSMDNMISLALDSIMEI